MKKIETMARESYFASEHKKKDNVDNYTDGYKKGFLCALEAVRECLNQSNNKLRIESINNLIDEYGNEGSGSTKEKVGDEYQATDRRV